MNQGSLCQDFSPRYYAPVIQGKSVQPLHEKSPERGCASGLLQGGSDSDILIPSAVDKSLQTASRIRRYSPVRKLSGYVFPDLVSDCL
jgi:hypothetical protein